jgi:hypothetical protein
MFDKLQRALSLYRLYCRCEDALKAGMEKPTMSKTKLGAVLAGIGALIPIVIKVVNGEADWVSMLPEALTIIGGVIAVFGARNALDKIGQ